MSAGGLLLPIYRASTALLAPLAEPLLRRRLRHGKEDGPRLGERLGHPGRPRPPGPLVWLHGASVGEGLAVLPLLQRLAERDIAVLITTGTVTSARVLEGRLPASAIHQYLPLDVPAFMRRFLDHWRPDLVLLAESELWPNLVFAAARQAIPLVLVNARLSERSFARWRRAPRFIGAMLDRSALCLAQTDADAARLSALGGRHVRVTGNVKYDVPPPPAAPEAVAAMRERIGGRPVWVAASTHADEEATILDAHGRTMNRFADLLTIVVPRRAERGLALMERVAGLGLRAGLRSRGDAIAADTQVFVADTMGELGLFYRLSDLVFVGKSLKGGGGQNPIEPAKLGCAILHGPEVANFLDVYRALDAGGGALEVADGAALAKALADLLADAPRRRDMARRASETVERHGGSTARIMDAIEPYLRAAADRQT